MATGLGVSTNGIVLSGVGTCGSWAGQVLTRTCQIVLKALLLPRDHHGGCARDPGKNSVATFLRLPS